MTIRARVTSPIITVNADNTVEYGTVPCGTCRSGVEHWGVPRGHLVDFRGKPCQPCKGTGRRGSGHCRTCNGSYERSRTNRPYPPGVIRDVSVAGAYDAGPCDTCQASGYVPATRYDYMPAHIVAAIMERVIMDVRCRALTTAERLFGAEFNRPAGVTSLGAATDYGRRWDRSRKAYEAGALDDFLVVLGEEERANIVKHAPHQILSFVGEDDTAIVAVRILLGPEGIARYGLTATALARMTEVLNGS